MAGGKARELVEGGVDAAREELAVVEDRLEAVFGFEAEDHLGIVARVAREEHALVQDDPVAREGGAPAGAESGMCLCGRA